MVSWCPSLQWGTKDLPHAEKQTVLSRICGLQDLLQMQWLCSQLFYLTPANQWTVVEIELLATVGRKCGCQPFSCRCSQNVTRCRKEICSVTYLFKASIPATPFGNSQHPNPTSSRFLIATVHSAFWLHHAHPFVPVVWKTCLIEISRGFCHGGVVSKICYNAVIVLSVVLCDCCKPMNSCRDWAFSNSGLEVGLPAFQLPMFSKCDSLPKGYLGDMFVFRNPFQPFRLGIPSIQTLREAWVPESGSTLHHLCIVVASCPSLRWATKDLPHAEKQRVLSRICGLQDLLQMMQWLCSQLFYLTSANQWTVVEIELLATVGWKCGCQPFSCRCSQNVTAERRFVRHTCLRHPFLQLLSGIPIINSLQEAGSWERQHAPPPVHCGCMTPIPLLRHKRSASCREAEGLVMDLWSPRFVTNAVIVLSVVLPDSCKPMNSCRDWAFSNSGLEVWLPAFQLPMFAKYDTQPKGDLFDMLV